MSDKTKEELEQALAEAREVIQFLTRDELCEALHEVYSDLLYRQNRTRLGIVPYEAIAFASLERWFFDEGNRWRFERASAWLKRWGE